MLKFLNIFKKMDWLLLVAVFLLICFGLSSLYSLGLGQDKNFNLLNKQIVFSILGLILMFAISFFDYRWWRFLSVWLYLILIILLILVLFLGKNLGGTTGWFILGDFSFQPVELAKLFGIIFLSRCLTQWVSEKYQVSLYVKTLLIILPVCILILIQPDFGSMAVIFTIWFLMLAVTGIQKKHAIVFLLIILILTSISWQFFLHDYQRDRILTFINPNTDPLGTGYNVRQSMIAIGSGGAWGRGLGLGTQSQLRFLPISEADFIFASISEELGFVGASVIFILYFIFFYRLFKILKNVKDDFGLFLVFGLSAMFFIQVIINIGMCVGVLPVTGLPLPFVSYGGSFLIISLISIGIIQSVKMRS